MQALYSGEKINNKMNFHSDDVVGFDSTWDKQVQDKQVLVRDSGTDAMESALEFNDKSSSTQETETSEKAVRELDNPLS